MDALAVIEARHCPWPAVPALATIDAIAHCGFSRSRPDNGTGTVFLGSPPCAVYWTFVQCRASARPSKIVFANMTLSRYQE